jgi:hypothetical protein
LQELAKKGGDLIALCSHAMKVSNYEAGLRDADGSLAGFIGYADGVLKLPPKWWEPAARNVVRFPMTV